jgi:hypothetical protein
MIVVVVLEAPMGNNMKDKNRYNFGETNLDKKNSYREKFDKFLASINYRKFTRPEFIEYSRLTPRQVNRGLHKYLSLKQQEMFNSLCLKPLRSKPKVTPNPKGKSKLNYADVVNTLLNNKFNKDRLSRYYKVCSSTMDNWLNKTLTSVQANYIRSLYILNADRPGGRKLVEKKINRKWKYDLTNDNTKLPIGKQNVRFKC